VIPVVPAAGRQPGDASQFQEIAGQRPALPMLYATGKPRSINQAFASSASCSNRAE